MRLENRVDRIERRLATGEIDVVFIISDEERVPDLARINGEEFKRQENETLQQLAERALQLYRTQHKPTDDVSVVIMDCRAEASFDTQEPVTPFQDCAVSSSTTH